MRSTLLAVSLLWFAPSLDGVLEKLDRWLDLQLAAVVDAGTKPPADSGAPVIDAGKPDAGGVLDAGVADAGRDAGVVDSGQPQPGETAVRPSYSKGRGFFVVGDQVYDGNGALFKVHGSNRTHVDSASPAYGKTRSNFTRPIVDPEPWLVYSVANVIKWMTDPGMGGTTASRMVQAPGHWKSTCRQDLAIFESIVQRWVDGAKTFQSQSEHYMWLNIANEALNDEQVWEDRYKDAIKRIRAAGWEGVFLVDGPGCAQNAGAIVRHGRAVFDADPQKNVVMSVHVYGNFWDSATGVPREWRAAENDLEPMFAALKATGLPILIGEFGPGRNIGPSPTTITPARIYQLVDKYDFVGEASWSIDDWSGPNESSSEDSFGHYKNGGDPNSALTAWGQIAVSRWNAVAKPATIFPAAAPSQAARSLMASPEPAKRTKRYTPATMPLGKVLH